MGNTEIDDNGGIFYRVSRMSFREVEGYNASEDPQKRGPVTRESTSVSPRNNRTYLVRCMRKFHSSIIIFIRYRRDINPQILIQRRNPRSHRSINKSLYIFPIGTRILVHLHLFHTSSKYRQCLCTDKKTCIRLHRK